MVIIKDDKICNFKIIIGGISRKMNKISKNITGQHERWNVVAYLLSKQKKNSYLRLMHAI
jgi:hypothetical protein